MKKVLKTKKFIAPLALLVVIIILVLVLTIKSNNLKPGIYVYGPNRVNTTSTYHYQVKVVPSTNYKDVTILIASGVSDWSARYNNVSIGSHRVWVENLNIKFNVPLNPYITSLNSSGLVVSVLDQNNKNTAASKYVYPLKLIKPNPRKVLISPSNSNADNYVQND